METPPDCPAITLRQRITRGFLALVGVIMLYALSSGPIFALGRIHPRVNRVLATVYDPLLVCAIFTSLDKPLVGYITWWIRLADPPIPASCG